jgi:hypothetical protein
MNQEQLRTTAFNCGGKTYTDGPMRAVVGVSLTWAQLQAFASAIAADERGIFARTAAEWNSAQVNIARLTERDRCHSIVQALAEGNPVPVLRAILEQPSCSSLCHSEEPCSLTEDGKCSVGARS